MISDSNINAITGKKDIIIIFIVYKLNSISGPNGLKCALFGNDNGGYDKFICFANTVGTIKSMIISGLESDWQVIGSDSYNYKYPYAAYKTKAKAGELNKWVCLSIHWDNYTTPKTQESKLYINGQEICYFKSIDKTGDVKLILGDLKNSSYFPLDGSIAFFSVLKYQKMTNKEILTYHYLLCNLWNIDHLPINI